MRILFLYPIPDPKYHIVRYHHGLGYLTSILKRNNHQVQLRYIYKYDENRLSSIIDSFRPELIGVSVTTNQFDLSSQVTTYIHRRHNLPIIWGGIHATVSPDESLATEGVMGICVGEGEEVVPEFVDRLGSGGDFSAVDNFWFKLNGRTAKNKIRPFIKNLDELPFSDRDIFNYQKLLDDYPQLELSSGRGCPFNCTYCVNFYLNRVSENNKLIRKRSVQNIMKEIEEIKKKYSRIETVLFVDDLFAVNNKWLKEFSEEYGRGFHIPFWCNTRADIIDEERINYLKESGCEQINMGIESGNDYIRKEVMKRNISREQIKDAFKMVKNAGIKVWAFNMIGLPGETEDTIRETIELNREVRPDYIFCSIFYPYPGTELYDLCKSHGWISDRKITSYFEPVSVLNLPTISSSDISYYYEIFKGIVFYPRLEGIINYLTRIKISPRKSLYSLVRDLDWAITRTLSRIFPKRIKDYIKSIVRCFRNLTAKSNRSKES